MRSTVAANPMKREDVPDGHPETSSSKSYYPMYHATTKYTFSMQYRSEKRGNKPDGRARSLWFSESEFTIWRGKDYPGHIVKQFFTVAVV
ncbi:MAG: hypothetical protein U0173_00150 [Nitrospiraceae bacterium]